MKRKSVLIGGGVVALAILAGIGWWLTGGGAGGHAGPPPVAGEMQTFEVHSRPQPAPELFLQDVDGRALSLADFAGRYVLLNLWATWCPPCVHEMPSLDRLQAQLGDDRFEVVTLSIDREGLEIVAPFYADHGLEHLAIYLDPESRTPRALQVRGLPTTFLFDPEGREIGRFAGPADWDGPDAVALIRHYLNADAPGAGMGSFGS